MLGAPQQCLPGGDPAVQAAHTKPRAGPLQSWHPWGPFPTLRASVPWRPAERVSREESPGVSAPEPVGPPLGLVASPSAPSSLPLGNAQLGLQTEMKDLALLQGQSSCPPRPEPCAGGRGHGVETGLLRPSLHTGAGCRASMSPLHVPKRQRNSAVLQWPGLVGS